MIKVEFKKLYTDTTLPKKANESDAGFDLHANSIKYKDGLHECENDLSDGHFRLYPNKRTLIRCGFSMALPNGYEAQVRPRSGLALKNGISIVNAPGTIDASYRNEVGVILINHSEEQFVIKKNDRIAQMVIQKLPEVEVVEVEEFTSKEDRGGGFGSTGV